MLFSTIPYKKSTLLESTLISLTSYCFFKRIAREVLSAYCFLLRFSLGRSDQVQAIRDWRCAITEWMFVDLWYTVSWVCLPIIFSHSSTELFNIINWDTFSFFNCVSSMVLLWFMNSSKISLISKLADDELFKIFLLSIISGSMFFNSKSFEF